MDDLLEQMETNLKYLETSEERLHEVSHNNYIYSVSKDVDEAMFLVRSAISKLKLAIEKYFKSQPSSKT